MACCGGSGKRKARIAPRMKHFKRKQTLLAQSSNPPLSKIMMCQPKFYGVEYEINPWMKLGTSVNGHKATEQWNNLCDRIKEHGGEIVYAKAREGLPDMVFTANAGLYLKDKNTVIVSNFKHLERQAEQWWFLEFFKAHNIQAAIPVHTFEGAGDALFLGDTLVGGYGFRSEVEAYQEIRPMLSNDPVVVELMDPYFYHLDTCFCPLNDLDYLIYPEAFNGTGLEAIRQLGGNEITVPEQEAKQFACNAVKIGNVVILPCDCPITTSKLQEKGYRVISVPMTEFIKAGGACKCLTLAI